MSKSEDAGPDTGGKSIVLICVAFGVSLLLEAYVLGILLGGWLDERFASGPLFTVAGVFLALAASFYQLFRALAAAERSGKNKGK